MEQNLIDSVVRMWTNWGWTRELRCEDDRFFSQKTIKKFVNYYKENTTHFSECWRFARNEINKKVGDVICYNFISATSENPYKHHNIWCKAIKGAEYNNLIIFKNCYGLDISDVVHSFNPSYDYQKEVILFGKFKIVEKSNNVLVCEQVLEDFDVIYNKFIEIRKKYDKDVLENTLEMLYF